MYLVVGLFLVSSLSKVTFLNNRQRELGMTNGPGVYMNLGKLNSTTNHATRDGRRKIFLQHNIQDVSGGMDRNKDNVMNLDYLTEVIASATRNVRNKVSRGQIQESLRQLDRNNNNVVDIPDEFVNRTHD